MDEIFGEIGSALGDFFASPPVQFILQAIAVYLVVLWLAGAYWAFRDMQHRTENPILPYVAASFVIVFTPVFFPLAIFVYKIIRPHEKIGEVYERNLAEEALLAEVESIKSCPTCARRVNDEWIICPTCRTRLNRVCPNCSRLVGLDWSLCAWCGKDFERRDLPAAAVGRPAQITPLPGTLDDTGRIAKTAAEGGSRRSARASRSSSSRPAPQSLPAQDILARGLTSSAPLASRGLRLDLGRAADEPGCRSRSDPHDRRTTPPPPAGRPGRVDVHDRGSRVAGAVRHRLARVAAGAGDRAGRGVRRLAACSSISSGPGCCRSG